MVKKAAPPESRFWSSIVKTDSCWLWIGTVNSTGYGYFQTGGRGTKKARAHRYAYEFLVGPIPKGLVLDHLCRVKICVNPEHLQPVTQRENVLRGEVNKNNRKPKGN